MKATDRLSAEHRVILSALDSLEAAARNCRNGNKLDAEFARAAVDFLRNFADHCHHAKEEGHLFPLLESRGMPPEGGPTGVMKQEHVESRGYVAGMDDAIGDAANGDPEALGRFAQNASRYIGLLRQHIDKEDNILYTMAENLLSPEDQDSLERTFAEVDEKEIGAEVIAKYRRVAEELAERAAAF